jgi:PEP-CTERM motif-containing protein
MRLRKLLEGTGLATVLMCAGPAAHALPLDLGGYVGPITIKFANDEDFTGGSLAPGASNFGIFSIQSILNNTGSTIYSAPTGTPTASNPLIVGVFSGINVTNITGTPPTAHTFNTGGVFSLYDDTTTAFGTIASQGTGGYGAAGGGCAVNMQCYNDITNKGFTNILNLSLVPGADSAALTSTLYGTVLSSTPLTGLADGYGDITGGTDAGQIQKGTETTAAGTKADVFFEDDFCTTGLNGCVGNPAWPISSEDPIDTAVVPEPGSLGLLGTALVAASTLWRRRRRRS